MSDLGMLDVLYGVKAKITGRSGGNGISGRINFRATSDRKLTDQDIAIIQKKLGYHPMGYGLFSISRHENIDKCIYTWKCSASCD